MGAPKGNQYWKLREVSGAPFKYETPQDLLDAGIAYFEWVEENPLQPDPRDPEKQLCRPMTEMGLRLHSGMSICCWEDYKKREGYTDVAEFIVTNIRANKFEGAVAGYFREQIIIRDLGLAEKREVQSKTDLNLGALSKEELLERAKALNIDVDPLES